MITILYYSYYYFYIDYHILLKESLQQGLLFSTKISIEITDCYLVTDYTR